MNFRSLRDWLDLIAADTPIQDIATGIARNLLGRSIERQHFRHASAKSLGLVVEGRCHDLSYDALCIDHTLLKLLDGSDLSIRDAARLICSDSELLMHDGDEIWINWLDTTVIAEHIVLRPPIISAWISIGRGRFNGTNLEIPDILPEALLTAAPGRRLGEIVSTGRSQIDDRLIKSASRFNKRAREGGWHISSETEFILEANWVTLGNAQ